MRGRKGKGARRNGENRRPGRCCVHGLDSHESKRKPRFVGCDHRAIRGSWSRRVGTPSCSANGDARRSALTICQDRRAFAFVQTARSIAPDWPIQGPTALRYGDCRSVRCGYVDRRCTTGWHDETHCWIALHAACPGDRETRWRGWRACAHSSSSRVASGEPPVGSSPPLAGQGNRKRPVDDSPTGGSAEHHSSISTIVMPFHTSVTPASPGRCRVRLSGRAACKVGPTRAQKAELREVRPANAIRPVLAAGREKFSRIDCNSLS